MDNSIAQPSVSTIGPGISNAVRDSSKFPMTKVLKDGGMETTIIAAKKTGHKKNSIDLWKKRVFQLPSL